LKKRCLILFHIFLFWFGCAYFNTFYNASQFYREAELDISAVNEDGLSENAIDLLNKTIIRCNTVISDHPESRFVDDAILLRSKAQYHLGQLSGALNSIRILESKFPDSTLLLEASLWEIRCEWKNGVEDSALSKTLIFLTSLNKDEKLKNYKKLKSLGHKTASEIYQQEGNVDSSLAHLEMAADIASNRTERMSAHYLIAEKAFKEKRLLVALQNYRKVVSSHPSPKHVETAHLQIVRIYREMEEWELASGEIEDLTITDKFSRIKADLNLELAKLYEMQGRKEEAIHRYQLITEQFPRTRASAESYYKMGSFTLQKEKDYAEARKYFDNVEKEFRQSTFAPSAKVRVREIDDILVNIKAIQELDAKLFGRKSDLEDLKEKQLSNDLIQIKSKGENDDSPNSVSDISVQLDSSLLFEEMAFNLYSAGELEAFRFGHLDTGMEYFKRIINELPDTKRTAQAIYSLSYLHSLKGDSTKSEFFNSILLESFNESEFAQDIAHKKKQLIVDAPAEMMIVSESLIETNPDSALILYEEILNKYPNTRYAPIVLLSIAHIYDRHLNKLPEARGTYERLIKSYAKSDQANFANDRIVIFDRIISLTEEE